MGEGPELEPASVVTLLTDFGLVDPFVGMMKGVMLELNPKLQIVDLCHSIERQNVREAAFKLMVSCRYFPRGTIHLAAVDPGVGTQRKILACQTERHFFLGPDNGLLSPVLEREGLRRCVAVTNSAYFLKPVSRTFHGRDIFAPVAAHLTLGVPLSELGPPDSLSQWVHFPKARQADEHTLLGEVLSIDRFGNLMTNLDEEGIRRLMGETAVAEVRIAGTTIEGLSAGYAAEHPGILLSIIGSSGFLEIALNLGSAREFLRVDVGAPVDVRAKSASA